MNTKIFYPIGAAGRTNFIGSGMQISKYNKKQKKDLIIYNLIKGKFHGSVILNLVCLYRTIEIKKDGKKLKFRFSKIECIEKQTSHLLNK